MTQKLYIVFENRNQNSNTIEPEVFFLQLGTLLVKIESHIPELTAYINTFFGFCINQNTTDYDRSIIIRWLEKDINYKALSPNSKAVLLPAEGLTFEDRIRKMGHLFVKQIHYISLT
ncbi:MAG: hypothetical protein LBV75_05705, partial [Paludibacter sp.]|nr:hypothetical protein [Paludibacter sp.]